MISIDELIRLMAAQQAGMGPANPGPPPGPDMQLAAAAPDPMEEYAKSLVPGASLLQKLKEYFGLSTPPEKPPQPQWGGKPMAIPGRPGYILMPNGTIIGPDGKPTK
jgi:hypothetical protein